MKWNSKQKLYAAGGAVAGILVIAIILAAALGSCGAGKYDKYFSEGEKAYNDGDYTTAIKKLEKAVAASPEEDAYLLMAEAYVSSGDDSMAIQVLYLGYSKTGSDAIAKKLDELKNSANGISPSDGATVDIAGTSVELSSTSLVLADMGLRDADIYPLSAMNGLESLSLSDNRITDISALSGLTELNFLQLSGNEISDISALSGLTRLKTLYLDENPITDLTPLYSLTSLKTLSMKGIEVGQSQLAELQDALPGCSIYSDEAVEEVVDVQLGSRTFKSDVTELDISGERLTDISELTKCKKLVSLNLSSNNISDISVLVDLQELQSLNISGNSISDLNPLLSLQKLQILNAADNVVSDISVVGHLPELRQLELGGNDLETGLTALGKLTKLEGLGLKGTGIDDEQLEQLYTLTELKTLNIEDNDELTANGVDALADKLTGCSIEVGELSYAVKFGSETFRSDAESITALSAGVTDITGLEHFESLKTLVLTNNSVSSIKPLETLTGLEHLDLYSNKVTDLSPLRGHTSLITLDIMRNGVSDISALSGCTGLEELHLGYNSLTSLRGISGCTSLRTLEAEGNKISDISDIAGLSRLRKLDLDDNPIADFTPLYSLTRLETLYIRGTGISEAQLEELQRQLPDCNILSDAEVSYAKFSASDE